MRERRRRRRDVMPFFSRRDFVAREDWPTFGKNEKSPNTSPLLLSSKMEKPHIGETLAKQRRAPG